MLRRNLANRRQHDSGIPEPKAECERCADQLPRLFRESKGDEGDKCDQPAAHDHQSTRSQLRYGQPDWHLRCTNDEDASGCGARHRCDITEWHPSPFEGEREIGINHGDAEDLGELNQDIDRNDALPVHRWRAWH